MYKSILYKLCCILIASWSLLTIASKITAPRRFLQSVESLIYRTERKWTGNRILSSCKDLHRSDGQYSTIYYSDTDMDYVPLILRTADMYMPMLSKDFGLDYELKATIIIYGDEVLFKNAIGGSEMNLPMGAYYGGMLNILSPGLWARGGEAEVKDRFISSGPIAHELTHYILDIITSGNCDTWFSEGVALYYEYKYTGYEWRSDLKDESRRIRFSELEKNFRGLDQNLAYRRSFDIVWGIINVYGEEGLQRIIDGLSDGKSFQIALAAL